MSGVAVPSEILLFFINLDVCVEESYVNLLFLN